MRPPTLRLSTSALVVDCFAGGGGTSTGLEWALGRPPDIAINHDPVAVAMHMANHPHTKHYCENILKVDPREVCGSQRVALAWFSPDCKHFSKAKGGKPRSDDIRSLAWVVIDWAKKVRPEVIMLENVEEFQTWGPLLRDGTPCPLRKGLTFRRWLAQLRNCGYEVDFKELRACDYGAPTTRKRLFLIARCDGKPIVWPKPTHGDGLRPYRTAAECIDFSLPAPSIFGRKKPLAANTLRRIARGMDRYVFRAADPFIIPVTHQGDARVHSIREPMRTVTGAKRGELAAVVPYMIQKSWGERKGQLPRILDIHQPLGTVVAGGIKQAVVAAFLAKHYGGHEATGSRMHDPMDTITAVDHHSLVTSHLVNLRGGLKDHKVTGRSLREPAPTVTAQGNHLAEVRAFLMKYHGTPGDDGKLREPFRTLTTKHRYALVTVHGREYVVTDIGMRMLVPGELYLAQSFPRDYIIDVTIYGEPITATDQVRMCGNAVPPIMAEALAGANLMGERTARSA